MPRVHLGPLETIINVGWASGLYVVVDAIASYVDNAGNNTTDSGSNSRVGVLELNAAAKAVGATIVAQRNIHIGVELAPDPPVQPHPAMSRFLAVLKFPRAPVNEKSSDGAFTLRLTGGLTYEDLVYPNPTQTEFCGTITTQSTGGPIYSQPNPFAPGVLLFFQDVTFSRSGPDGNTNIAYTLGPLADCTPAVIGTGAYNRSTIDNSIWYRDQFGNYVNTYRPCSELVPPSQPKPPAKKTSGWTSITTSVFFSREVTVLPEAQWTVFSGLDEIMVFSATPLFGGPLTLLTIPEVQVGVNSDFLPITDHLPAGTYSFRYESIPFTQFPAQPPFQLDPVAETWALPGAYPLVPSFAKFDIAIGTSPPYTFHTTTPENARKFNPGNAPPSSQTFTP